jgi:4-amino-4-deoxy-L-arabinose transferase-like glycosyltransferase
MLYFVQGLISVLVFNLYLFFFPQLYIFLGYEALGEMPSMVYILISFVLFTKATQAEKSAGIWFFASGILAGLAINTRLATMIAFGGFAVIWLILYRQKKIALKEALIVVAGVLLIAVLWQLIVFFGLLQVSDFSNYVNHLLGRFEFFYRSLKGITPIAEGVELFLLKAIIVSEISYSHLLVSLVLVLTTGLGGIVLIRHLWADPARRNLVILLWTAWFIYTVWFLNGPKNAWVRYYWYGLIWMAMLLGLMFAALSRQLRLKPNWANVVGSLFLAVLFVFSFSSQPQSINFFITPELIELWRQRQLTTRDTYLPWIVLPRAEQEQAAELIRNLPADARIYYPEGHKTAELSFLTNRIFYTMPRRSFMGPGPNDVIIMGPAIISPWKKEQQQRLDILETIHRECPAIILESPNYIICAAE